MTAGVHAALAAAEHPGGILVVGHGGALRLFLSATFDRPFTPIANGGVLRVSVVDGRLHDVHDLGVVGIASLDR